jgi:U4/U6 small nuclear ribonucleoprotein PRP4
LRWRRRCAAAAAACYASARAARSCRGRPDADTPSSEPSVCCAALCVACAAAATLSYPACAARAGVLLRTLTGHSDRLGRCAFHPSGALLATASFDATWRLWDVERGTELMCQEGHGRAVVCVAFQRDGALALSGGMDGHGRVWDMRTGRCVLTLSGHVKALLCADWAPGGTLCATGAGDNAARVWDVRAAGRAVAQLPAHASLLSTVRFEPDAGAVLLTSSYDATLKAWSGADWCLLRAMRAGDARVMAADMSARAETVATVGYDRSVKIWVAQQRPALDGDAIAENGGDAHMGDAA